MDSISNEYVKRGNNAYGQYDCGRVLLPVKISRKDILKKFGLSQIYDIQFTGLSTARMDNEMYITGI